MGRNDIICGDNFLILIQKLNHSRDQKKIGCCKGFRSLRCTKTRPGVGPKWNGMKSRWTRGRDEMR